MTSSLTLGIKTVLHPVSDLERAKPVYAALLGTMSARAASSPPSPTPMATFWA